MRKWNQWNVGKAASMVILAGMVLCAWSTEALGTEKATEKASDKPGTQGGEKNETYAIIKTKFGEMEIRFYPDKAPKHVENFIKLAKDKVYDGTIFHRVIPGFMIQGGDPNTKDPNKKEMFGMGGPGYSVKAEFNDTPHKRGIVSMARSQDPDSAGSQFFIVVEDSRFLDRKYTVFGEVIKGMGVADKIVNQERDAKDNPLERVEMKVEIVEK